MGDQTDDAIREERPLQDLSPFNVDDDDEDSVNKTNETAKALDHFRFFINNIWFPWDEDNDEEDENWIAEHLSLRVILHDRIILNDRAQLYIINYLPN